MSRVKIVRCSQADQHQRRLYAVTIDNESGMFADRSSQQIVQDTHHVNSWKSSIYTLTVRIGVADIEVLSRIETSTVSDQSIITNPIHPSFAAV